MLRLKPMALRDVPEVVPLFLDDSLMRLWEDGTTHDPESAENSLRGYFQHPSHHWTMSWNDHLAGYGHILWSDYLESWIVSYLVARRFQGKGIATAFVGESKTFALEKGIECLEASAHPENLASIRVLEKSGFRSVGASSPAGERLYRWLSPGAEMMD